MNTLKIFAISLLVSMSMSARAQIVVATNVTAAENSIQTTNQRVFVSSNGAFYELKRNGSVWSKTQAPAPFKDGHSGSCYFLGITETAGTLYTVCTENNLNPLARKHLFGMSIYQTVPQLTEVGELHNMALPNGLAADSSGNLYVADLGLPFLAGSIQKITLAGSYAIATQSLFYQFALCKPNGLRYANGKLYVSLDPFSYLGLSQLLRYDLNSNGLSNKTSIYSSFTFLDDFELVSGGVVVAEYFGGVITHVSESDGVLHKASFSQPTSVRLLTAPAFGPSGLLVTEGGNNDVKWIANTWGLQSR